MVIHPCLALIVLGVILFLISIKEYYRIIQRPGLRANLEW